MTDRAISTVLDVTTCLLLVTAAVGVLVAAPTGQDHQREKRTAAEVADAVTTTTAQVEYAADPIDGEDAPEYPEEGAGAYERSGQGTLAALLASAAVADAGIDGERVVPHDAFPRRVENVTDARLSTATRGESVRVAARWEPYPDAPVSGTVEVGPTPPPGADVEAATTTVSAPARCKADTIDRAARHYGYGGPARILSTCAVRAWFPPDATEAALRGQPPAAELATHRYRRAADLLDTAVEEPVRDGDVRTANERLIDQLALRFVDDLERSYETPERAAAATSVGRVRITVRTW